MSRKKSNKISQFADGNDEEVQSLYETNKEYFLIFFTQKYGIDREEAKELYHEALLIVIENIRSGKLKHDSDKPINYLIGIGVNQFSKEHKEKIKHKTYEFKEFNDPVDPIDHVEEHNEWRKKIQDAARITLRRMKGKCKTILIKFYKQNTSEEKIREILNYKSIDTVRTQKSRCLKQLKDRVHKELKRKHPDI